MQWVGGRQAPVHCFDSEHESTALTLIPASKHVGTVSASTTPPLLCSLASGKCMRTGMCVTARSCVAAMQYLDMIADIMSTGARRGDRTGTGTLSKFGCQMRFNLRHTFPLLTSKRTFFRGVHAF